MASYSFFPECGLCLSKVVTHRLRNVKVENGMILIKISLSKDVLNFLPAEQCVVCEYKLNKVVE